MTEIQELNWVSVFEWQELSENVLKQQQCFSEVYIYFSYISFYHFYCHPAMVPFQSLSMLIGGWGVKDYGTTRITIWFFNYCLNAKDSSLL